MNSDIVIKKNEFLRRIDNSNSPKVLVKKR